MSIDTGPSLCARWLGFAGLIPFVGLAAALWVAEPGVRPWVGSALLAYAAVIASFLGAIHWGLAMREVPTQPVTSMVWGVVPSLLGWVAVLTGHAQGLVVMTALLWACFAVDRALYPRYRQRAWLPMRLQLTLVASASCLAAAVALAR